MDSDTTVATLPASPSWAQTITPIDLGREFSAGFGPETPDSTPKFTVELVQTEYIDEKTEPPVVRRALPRLYFNGEDCSPEHARELIELIQTALAAIANENSDVPGH